MLGSAAADLLLLTRPCGPGSPARSRGSRRGGWLGPRGSQRRCWGAEGEEASSRAAAGGGEQAWGVGGGQRVRRPFPQKSFIAGLSDGPSKVLSRAVVSCCKKALLKNSIR